MNVVTNNCSYCGKELEPHRKNKYHDCASCHTLRNKKYKKKYSELNPEQRLKERCRCNAKRYYKKGIIKKEPCQQCGAAKTEMHHEDYRFPKLVTWLCRKCHLKLHMRLKKQQQESILVNSST